MTTQPPYRFHMPPPGPPAPVQPQWMHDAGVVLRLPGQVPPPPPGFHGQTPRRTWWNRLPVPVRVLLVLVSPLALWLAVCLLAAGWPVVVGLLIAQGAIRPRRKGKPRHSILRRPRTPYL